MTALVAAIVTLVLSPLANSVSFVVNEYLSRPLLAIEYVETVLVPPSIPLPADDIRALLMSPASRSLALLGYDLGGNLGVFQERDSIGAAELEPFVAALSKYERMLQSRVSQTQGWQKTLQEQPTDRQVREVAQRLAPETAMMMASMADARALGNTLLPRATSELESLRAGLRSTRSIRARLPTRPRDASGQLLVRATVINRGSSDGLLRNSGWIETSGAKLTLLRSQGPSSPPRLSPLARSAVPTYVVNPTQVETRETSVARVEQHSLLEMWFEVKRDSTTVGAFGAMWDALKNKTPPDASVVLVDHENGTLTFRLR